MKKTTLAVAIAISLVTSVSAETIIGGGSVGDQVAPCLAKTTYGLAVVWQDSKIDSRGWGIGLQRLNASLNPIGGVVRVNNQSFENQQNPTIASFSDGRTVIAWQSGRRGQQDVVFRQLQADGSWARSESYANTFRPGDQAEPSVAVLADQTFMIVWTSRGQFGAVNRGIVAQRFSKEGGRLGSEFRVDDDKSNDAGMPRLTANSDGGFSIYWISDAMAGALGRKLMVRQFSSDGVSAGAPGQVAGIAGDIREFSVAAYASGADLLIRHGASKTVVLYAVSGSSASSVRQFPSSALAEGVSLASDGAKILCSWSTKRADALGTASFSISLDRSSLSAGQPSRVSTSNSAAEISPAVVCLDQNTSALAWSRLSGNNGFDVVMNVR